MGNQGTFVAFRWASRCPDRVGGHVELCKAFLSSEARLQRVAALQHIHSADRSNQPQGNSTRIAPDWVVNGYYCDRNMKMATKTMNP